MANAALHVQIDGTGPHVVLLHPVGLDLTFFDPLVAQLGERLAVLRVDLPGHGHSPMLPVDGLEAYADAVHARLVEADWWPAAVIGFSFGGMLTQTLALKYPADVSAVVIAACASTLPDEARAAMVERGALAEREGMPAVVEATMARWWTEDFRRRGGDEPARQRLLANDVHAWASAWRAIAGVDTAARLSTLTAPALCLAGELDASAPPAVVEAIATRIPGARFHVIPGGSHMFFVERPEPTAAVIASFLADVR